MKTKTLPTQQRALRKRDALIDSAAIEFARHGFDTATAKSIAAAAGVATGTFYQYFSDKNDILRELAGQRLMSLQQQLNSLAFTKDADLIDKQHNTAFIAELFEQSLLFVYDFHAQQPELHQILEYRRSLDPQLNLIMSEAESAMQARVLQFVRSCDLPNADIVADNLFAMGEGVVHRHVFFHSANPIDKTISTAAAMLASYFSSNINQ